MIEYVLIAQLITAQPQTQTDDNCGACYKGPEYSKRPPVTNQSRSTSKQVEEFEHQLFSHPN